MADDNDSSYQKFSSGSNVSHLNVNLIAACVEKQEEMREKKATHAASFELQTMLNISRWQITCI